jgi:hypothetical protein
VAVDTLNLVIQRGAEWLWNWSPVGAVTLPASRPARLPGKQGYAAYPSRHPWRRRVRAMMDPR